MNLRTTTAIFALLFMAQGCDKVRSFISEKAGQVRGGDANSYAAEITEEDYESFINQRGSLIVVSFSAEWCGPCRQLAPVLERVAAEFGDEVKLGTVDVDRSRNIAMRNGVKGIPDVRFFRNGKQVHQFSGAQPDTLIRGTLTRLTEDAKAAGDDPKSLVERLLPKRETEEETKSEAPPIRPMEKEWLPPGIERR